MNVNILFANFTSNPSFNKPNGLINHLADSEFTEFNIAFSKTYSLTVTLFKITDQLIELVSKKTNIKFK